MKPILKYPFVFVGRKARWLAKGVPFDLASALACDGATELPELRELAKYAAQVSLPEGVVEIGCYRGRSTVALALACRSRRVMVYAIDPYLPIKNITDDYRDFGSVDREIFFANLLVSGAAGNTCCLHIPSVQAAAAWRGDTIGLLFIDGDHLYESTRQDYEAWFPHVASSGIIAFHDSVGLEWGSAQFVAELRKLRSMEEISVVGGTTFFRKLPVSSR